MTARRSCPALAAATLTWICAWPVLAAEDERGPTWAPGEETASTVRGEARSRDTSAADGVYGRFDGDLDLGVGLGAAWLRGRTLPAARATAHYFSTAGVALTYADTFGDSAVERSLGVGVDVRPAFLPRWALGHQTGPAFLDLTLDSISLGVGAYFDWGARDERGLDLSAALGAPLAGTAAGPWLEGRAALRIPDGGEDAGRAFGSAMLVLAWHESFLTRLTPRNGR